MFLDSTAVQLLVLEKIDEWASGKWVSADLLFLLSFLFLSFSIFPIFPIFPVLSYTMNALPTLKSLYDTVKHTKGWLVEPHLFESSLVRIADKILEYAEELQKRKTERIADLQKNGPKAYFESNTLCIALLRDGKEVFHEFPEMCVRMCATHEPDILRVLRVVGPPDESGMTYYISVRPEDSEAATHGIYVTKAEATTLDHRICEAWNAQRQHDTALDS